MSVPLLPRVPFPNPLFLHCSVDANSRRLRLHYEVVTNGCLQSRRCHRARVGSQVLSQGAFPTDPTPHTLVRPSAPPANPASRQTAHPPTHPNTHTHTYVRIHGATHPCAHARMRTRAHSYVHVPAGRPRNQANPRTLAPYPGSIFPYSSNTRQARDYQRALRAGADAFGMHQAVIHMKKERHASHRRPAPSQYMPE